MCATLDTTDYCGPQTQEKERYEAEAAIEFPQPLESTGARIVLLVFCLIRNTHHERL